MSMLLFNAANAVMQIISGTPKLVDESDLENSEWSWVLQVTDAIDTILYPLLILVGTAGTIYAVILGVNLARADSADKQQEAKKRMINAIIGLVSIIALILLLKLFCAYLPEWLNIGENVDVTNPSGGNQGTDGQP